MNLTYLIYAFICLSESKIPGPDLFMNPLIVQPRHETVRSFWSLYDYMVEFYTYYGQIYGIYTLNTNRRKRSITSGTTLTSGAAPNQTGEHFNCPAVELIHID